MRRHRWALVALLLTLSSCSDADMELRRIAALMQDALRQSVACETAILSRPRYGHLRSKLALGFEDGKPSMPTPGQLGDAEAISEDDIGAGLDWYAETEPCGRADIERMGQIDPELAMVRAQVMQDRATLVADMVKRRPSYGEINARLASFKQSEEVAATQVLHNIDFRLEAHIPGAPQPAPAFSSSTGDATSGRATMAVSAVSTLAARQLALAQTQQNYAAATPSYHAAAPITLTSCQWLGPTWTCQQF